MTHTTPYHRLCGLEVKDKHGSPCFAWTYSERSWTLLFFQCLQIRNAYLYLNWQKTKFSNILLTIYRNKVRVQHLTTDTRMWRVKHEKLHGFTDCIHGFTDCIHGFTDCIHGFTDSIHGFTDSIHGFTDCIHGFTDCIHGFTDSIHGFTDCIHGFTDCIITLELWRAFGHLWTTFMQTWYDDRYLCTLHFDTLTLIRGHRAAKKQNFCIEFSSKAVCGAGSKLVYCWDFWVWWMAYSFYLVWLILKGEKPTLVILLKKALWSWFSVRSLLTDFLQTWHSDRHQ